LQELNEGLRRQLEIMRSPAALQRRIQESNLGLAPAQPNQVLRLSEAGRELSRAERAQQLAAAPQPIQNAR
jgi:ribosome recycling factor